MGGAKTVDPSKYMSKPDYSRDLALMAMMQSAQAQQQANQAELLKTYSGMTPEQQTYNAALQSQRAAELGIGNIQKQRELEKLVNPEAEQMRMQESEKVKQLTDLENAKQFMNEYIRKQALPMQYETGLGDSSIGRAAMYDAALQAKQAYEQGLIAERQQYLAGKEAPAGGISPESSLAAQEAAKAQNIAAMQGYQNAMFGTLGQAGQSSADAYNQMYANMLGMKQAQQQGNLDYKNAMLTSQAQNQAAQNAMNAAYATAAGNVASSAITAYKDKYMAEQAAKAGAGGSSRGLSFGK